MKSLVWIFLVTGCSFGQQRQATPFVLPDDVALRKVDILSEGTRMAGELYALKSAAGTKLPTLIMSHGWGGTVAGLRRDAAAFAQAGYLVVAFDLSRLGRERLARDSHAEGHTGGASAGDPCGKGSEVGGGEATTAGSSPVGRVKKQDASLRSVPGDE